jgi:signal transduction histidine kinase
MDDERSIDEKVRDCEIDLEAARGLATQRERLLLENLKELNRAHGELGQKVRELKERDERIRGFDEVMTRANRLSSLGELAASIAHEIKNPLISIEGFAKRIEHGSDPEKIREYAGFIERESERLSAVLVRLLDFARLSEPEEEHLDINGLVDDTILFTEHHLTQFRKVRLTVEKEHDLPPVFADRVQIQQALINIIMNAAQAMPAGGPITIQTGKGEEDFVWVAVSDKGSGIEEAHLEKIFEPFFTTRAKGEGTGLGLSLTRKLVEANRGTIEVESTKGKGSTFRLRFPAGPIGRGDK